MIVAKTLVPCRAIATSRMRIATQYRAAAIAGAATQLFFGIVRMMIFDAFYANGATTAVHHPMTHGQVVTYIWLGQSLLLVVLVATDSEITQMIRDGSVVYELTRPIDLHTQWFARAFSWRGVRVAMRAVPIFIVAALFFGLSPPASAIAASLFALSAVLGLCISAAMVVLITTTLLWTISGEGISRLMPPLIFFFSGIVVPLPLLPDSLQAIVLALPFRALIDTPIRIYLGQESGLSAIAHQILWLVILIALGRFVLQRGLRRLVVQGG